MSPVTGVPYISTLEIGPELFNLCCRLLGSPVIV